MDRGCKKTRGQGDFFVRVCVIWEWVKKGEERKKEKGKKNMGETLLAPAGENLEHNTLVAARPNLNADGAFRLPPSIGLVD